MVETLKIPTNEQIREEALDNMPPDIVPRGIRGEYLGAITQHYLSLQFKYYPMFVEDTRRINIERQKILNESGNKSPTRYISGKTYDGTTGWSKDGLFKEKWIISNQLKCFMTHIHKKFWSDNNKKVRDEFMRGVITGQDAYELLNKVYNHYGSNVTTIGEKEIIV